MPEEPLITIYIGQIKGIPSGSDNEVTRVILHPLYHYNSLNYTASKDTKHSIASEFPCKCPINPSTVDLLGALLNSSKTK